MTPAELRTARGALSQQEFADLLHVRQSRISEWESGARPIPAYIAALVRCLEKAGELQ